MTKSVLRELGTPEASDKGERPKGPYRASIMEVLARIEAACARRGIQPSQMAAPSRNAYGLLSYLATDGKASAYVGTATTVSRIWARIAEQGSQHGSVIVSLDDQTHIYRCLRRDRSSSDLHLSPVFIGAPEPVLESVVRMAIGIGAPMDKAAVHEFVHGPVPREILSAIAGFSAPLAQTKGVVYDLNEVCERVRHAYFTPPVEPPSSLEWTDTLTYRMFGLYSSVRDRITISRSLDSPDVPQYVIDYVMFHELIHKHHGIGWVAKQRSMHGGRFKKTERSFPQYQAAQEYLNRLSTKLRRRRK